MNGKVLMVLGLAVFMPMFSQASETEFVSYCQVHCRAGDLKTRIHTLEGDIRRMEVGVSGTKPVAADNLRRAIVEKKQKLAALKDELVKLEKQMAQAESR